MDDCVLPVSFDSNPRGYDGINLTNNEIDVLTLPPKFEIYKKSNELVLKSQFEKAITCLRDNVFDHEENNFDFLSMKANTLPFNKRVYMQGKKLRN